MQPTNTTKTSYRPTPLAVPELPAGVDILTAALAYIAAGWYVLPVRRGSKNPGSVVGKRWQLLSSRDPQQIAAWFAGTDHGIALHCGRSDAVVFDVDRPEDVPDVLRDYSAHAPYQSTRPQAPGRGHYLFAVPVGRTFGNGKGQLAGSWGEVRGANGVIVVEPTPHTDSGRYHWERTGHLPLLPHQLAELLPDGSAAEGAASDSTVSAFLAEHVGNSRPDALDALLNKLATRIKAGESRHDSTVSVFTGAMKEARAGYYPARVAAQRIAAIFLPEMAAPSDPTRRALADKQARAELDGIKAWAVGQALASDPVETRARVDAKLPAPNVTELSELPLGQTAPAGDDETVRTVQWPELAPAALHGVPGEIVRAVEQYTEADPAAVLVQLLCMFGAAVGPKPHIVVANRRHPAIINPLIVGRTNSGAKGTGYDLAYTVAREAIEDSGQRVLSGLSMRRRTY
jgi:Bifunctional DNA primase/polymerase, N-terminal